MSPCSVPARMPARSMWTTWEVVQELGLNAHQAPVVVGLQEARQVADGVMLLASGD